MRTIRNRALVAMTIGLLVLGGAAFVSAGDSYSKSETMALQGCLSEDANGNFTLVEKESGDSIRLTAPEEVRIDEHVGQTVELTGSWEQGESGMSNYFRVSKIEILSESCDM